MRVYVIGPSGAGKTTFSKKLAKKYNTECYELDCLVYDDEHDHIKRSDEEIEKLFNNILKKKSWIIEDVGRRCFYKGFDECDQIYYLRISKYRVYCRVVKRWFKQRLGKEKYNYPPTLFQFYDMIRIARLYFKHEKDKLKKLEAYSDKVIYLSYKDLNNFK